MGKNASTVSLIDCKFFQFIYYIIIYFLAFCLIVTVCLSWDK